MCLEDLRLGRGRFLKRPTTTTTGGLMTMPADPTRVAVIMSLVCASGFNSATTTFLTDNFSVFFNANNQGQPDMVIGPGNSVVVMRIEDFGNAISGPITFFGSNNTGALTVTLAAICTEVNAPPLDTYKP